MKFRIQTLLLALFLSVNCMAQAQQRDQHVVDGILSLATQKTDIQTAPAGNKLDFSITANRGGSNSSRKLGLYGLNDDIEFRSGYAKLLPKEQAEWAYDLWQFVLANGGGFENEQRYAKEKPGTSLPPLGTKGAFKQKCEMSHRILVRP